MGLDMYLSKRTYFGRDQRPKIRIEGTEGVKGDRIKVILEEIGYWRKANAIHNWFVQNVQNGQDDCRLYYVTREQLRQLLDLVNQILVDHSKTEKLLPTKSGFFFGSTNYDQLYFQDLELTKTIIENALKENNGDIFYQSSW